MVLHAVPRGRDRWQVGLWQPTLVSSPEAVCEREVLMGLRERGVLPAAPSAAGVVLISGEASLDPAPLLRAAGLRPVRRHPDPPDAVLLLCAGEPDRARLEPWVRDQIPHLLVRHTDDAVTIGPLVVPGRTACVACIDLHHADDDPEFCDVLHRYVRASRHDHAPADAAATLAVAWAVRDLATHLAGGHPPTWSSTVTLGPGTGPDLITWMRHPACACGWVPTLGA